MWQNTDLAFSKATTSESETGLYKVYPKVYQGAEFLPLTFLSFLSPPSFTLSSLFNVELLRHYAHASLHIHLGSGPLAPSDSRNSPRTGARGEGQDGSW